MFRLRSTSAGSSVVFHGWSEKECQGRSKAGAWAHSSRKDEAAGSRGCGAAIVRVCRKEAGGSNMRCPPGGCLSSLRSRLRVSTTERRSWRSVPHTSRRMRHASLVVQWLVCGYHRVDDTRRGRRRWAAQSPGVEVRSSPTASPPPTSPTASAPPTSRTDPSQFQSLNECLQTNEDIGRHHNGIPYVSYHSHGPANIHHVRYCNGGRAGR